MGSTAAPGGQLFTLAAITIAAYFGGWLMMKITTLPGLIGMLIVGIILKNIGFVNFDEDYQKVTSYIRYIEFNPSTTMFYFSRHIITLIWAI